MPCASFPFGTSSSTPSIPSSSSEPVGTASTLSALSPSRCWMTSSLLLNPWSLLYFSRCALVPRLTWTVVVIDKGPRWVSNDRNRQLKYCKPSKQEQNDRFL